ncbi:MAG: Zn-ribbon domain-containing OB-fold protein [Thermoplasmata archaeon]
MGVAKKVERADKVKIVRGSFPVKYIYTMPPHLERFFQNLRENGELTGAVCERCGTVYVPPVWFCERCFVRVSKETTLPSEGELIAFTVARRGPEGEVLDRPEVYGLVRLKGASTVLLHRLLSEPSGIRSGIRVRLRLKEKVERRGSIMDIEGFVPVEGR